MQGVVIDMNQSADLIIRPTLTLVSVNRLKSLFLFQEVVTKRLRSLSKRDTHGDLESGDGVTTENRKTIVLLEYPSEEELSSVRIFQ